MITLNRKGMPIWIRLATLRRATFLAAARRRRVLWVWPCSPPRHAKSGWNRLCPLGGNDNYPPDLGQWTCFFFSHFYRWSKMIEARSGKAFKLLFVSFCVCWRAWGLNVCYDVVTPRHLFSLFPFFSGRCLRQMPSLRSARTELSAFLVLRVNSPLKRWWLLGGRRWPARVSRNRLLRATCKPLPMKGRKKDIRIWGRNKFAEEGIH